MSRLFLLELHAHSGTMAFNKTTVLMGFSESTDITSVLSLLELLLLQLLIC